MTDHPCKRPNVAVMDHLKGCDPADLVRMVSRMCLTCGRHWYGEEGAVREYTRAEWDAWITGNEG